jgi:hypothetical protein
MNPYSYTHLIFNQKHQKHTMEKRKPVQQMLPEKVVICLQKTELDPCLSPCISINSKWIKDLNIRPETLQLVHKREGMPWKQ